jgi:hypothetical protein
VLSSARGEETKEQSKPMTVEEKKGSSSANEER